MYRTSDDHCVAKIHMKGNFAKIRRMRLIKALYNEKAEAEEKLKGDNSEHRKTLYLISRPLADVTDALPASRTQKRWRAAV